MTRRHLRAVESNTAPRARLTEKQLHQLERATGGELGRQPQVNLALSILSHRNWCHTCQQSIDEVTAALHGASVGQILIDLHRGGYLNVSEEDPA